MDDLTKQLYEACLAVVEWGTFPDGVNWICTECQQRAKRRDLIHHAEECPVGMARAATVAVQIAEMIKREGGGGR